MSLSLAVALALAAQSKPPAEPPPPIVATPVAPPAVIVPVAPPITYAPPPPPPPPRAVLLPARPRMPLIYYFSEDDYPASALRAEAEGTTVFRLTVGPDGRVSDCLITESSGSTALDSATCRILRARARFAPATDASGNPVADHVSSRARWVLPRVPSTVVPDIELLAEANAALAARGIEPPRPLDALPNLFAAADYPAEAITAATLADTDLHLAVAADGRVAGCTIAASSGLAALDAAACRVLTERARFAPAIRPGAGAVGATLAVRLHWREDPAEEDGEEESTAAEKPVAD